MIFSFLNLFNRYVTVIYYPNWRIRQIYDEFVPFLKTFYPKEVEIYRYFGKSKFADFWEQAKCNLESSPRIWTLQCRRFNHRSGVWVSKMIKCTINLSQNEQRLFSTLNVKLFLMFHLPEIFQFQDLWNASVNDKTKKRSRDSFCEGLC